MKILVQADGIHLTPENKFDEQILALLEGPTEVYAIRVATLGANALTGSYRLVKKEQEDE